MSPSDSEKWAKFSKLGRAGFVWRYGILGWGIPTAILFVLLQGYLDGWDGLLFKLIPALVLFPLGGIVWGRFMWAFLERRHARAAATGAIK
jgi:hypothetical protein